jgi:hypothetical protein
MTTKRPHGGVSARKQWPASVNEELDKGELQRVESGQTSPGFTYQGGPIIASPDVRVTFWGAAWAGADAARRTDIVQFVQDFLASDYMNILSQYGVGEGAGKCGNYGGASDRPAVTGTIDTTKIETEIQAMVDGDILPEPGTPSEAALLIFLDESIEVRDHTIDVTMCEPRGDNAFGFHYFFTTAAGHKFYYAVIPSLTDTCLQRSCPGGDAQCSLQLATTQEQRQTQVASHEFSEMVSDPEINAWRDPATGAENGDICNGESGTITVAGRTWNVQKMYSYVDDRAGNSACLAGAPEPIPSQIPG